MTASSQPQDSAGAAHRAMSSFIDIREDPDPEETDDMSGLRPEFPRALQEQLCARIKELEAQRAALERERGEFAEALAAEQGRQQGILDALRQAQAKLAAAYQDLNIRYKRDHDIAAVLQRSFLFTPAPNIFPSLDIHALYEPASEEADVGGDFYDIFAIDQDLAAVAVGDVTGKGLPAASHTAQIKYALRAYLREHRDCVRAMSSLNRFLYDAHALDGMDQTTFVCLSVALVNSRSGKIVLCVAGAEPPLIVRASTQAEPVTKGGLPLAVERGADYEAAEAALFPGDLLVLSTDGITEARIGASLLGYEGMTLLARQSLAAPTLEEAANTILSGAKAAAGGTLSDDACVLMVRRRRAG